MPAIDGRERSTELLGAQPRARAETLARVRRFNPLTACGIALLAVGWIDLGLLWLPARFGNPSWEFGTVSAHLDGMPLATVGLALLAAGVAAGDRLWLKRSVAVWSGLIVLLLLGLLVVFWLTVPIALRSTGVGVELAIRKSILKTNLFALVYIAFHAWLGWQLWRRR